MRTRGDGCDSRRAPLVVIISVTLFTRSGCSAARCWAIMPPIEAPHTWARCTPSASSTPRASLAMSAMLYADLTGRCSV